MADWSLLGAGQNWLTASRTNSRGVNATPSATANTKGSYGQLISAASNTVEATGVLATIRSSVGIDYLVDIAIGTAGSEVIIAQDLYSGAVSQNLEFIYFLPIAIASGTRVAARSQAISASAGAATVCLNLVGQGFMPSQPLQRVTTYGANTADSGGVQIDPGGTVNTKGSWSEITSSTTNDCRYLILAHGKQAGANLATGDWLVDIGIGAAGSETTLIGNLHLSTYFGTVDGFWTPPTIGPLPVSIPAGTRLSARAQSSLTASNTRVFDIIAYGID